MFLLHQIISASVHFLDFLKKDENWNWNFGNKITILLGFSIKSLSHSIMNLAWGLHFFIYFFFGKCIGFTSHFQFTFEKGIIFFSWDKPSSYIRYHHFRLEIQANVNFHHKVTVQWSAAIIAICDWFYSIIYDFWVRANTSSKPFPEMNSVISST